jgi:anti-sigma B factor antagonist
MFEIESRSSDRIVLRGRFDAAQEERAREVLDRVAGSCTLDLEELTYISSAGLGLLVALQLRLSKRGAGVTLAHVNPHIRELLRLSGLDQVFAVT